jgi:CheY-like chemotaxis protein
MNVLIAEDDALTRLMPQRAAEHQGHACLVAQDGLEAWQLFQAHMVDVVISDWLMPFLDGVELWRRVRKQMDVSRKLVKWSKIRPHEHFDPLSRLPSSSSPLSTEDVRPTREISSNLTDIAALDARHAHVR